MGFWDIFSGLFWNKKNEGTTEITKLNATVLLIMQSAKIVMTSKTLKKRPKKWLGGAVLEVMISRPGMDPFFIYYENSEYYSKMVVGVDLNSAQKWSNYRSEMSVELCKFLVAYMAETHGKDIRHQAMQFSHNKIHTNVVTYIDKLKGWYPIQHGATENDNATNNKIALINEGADVSEFVAMHRLSP